MNGQRGTWFDLGRSGRALKRWILRLQPCPGPAAHVARSDALRDDAFEVHPAGVPENGGAVPGERVTRLFHRSEQETAGRLRAQATWHSSDLLSALALRQLRQECPPVFLH